MISAWVIDAIVFNLGLIVPDFIIFSIGVSLIWRAVKK